jgi:predicted oxidoreductase
MCFKTCIKSTEIMCSKQWFSNIDQTLSLIEVESYKNHKNIIIGWVYRHPHADLDNFSSQLEDMIKTFNHNNQLVYILGDLNIDFLKYVNKLMNN